FQVDDRVDAAGTVEQIYVAVVRVGRNRVDFDHRQVGHDRAGPEIEVRDPRWLGQVRRVEAEECRRRGGDSGEVGDDRHDLGGAAEGGHASVTRDGDQPLEGRAGTYGAQTAGRRQRARV